MCVFVCVGGDLVGSWKLVGLQLPVVLGAREELPLALCGSGNYFRASAEDHLNVRIASSRSWGGGALLSLT